MWNRLVATHSFRDVRDGLDTLVVAGSVISVEQACKDPSLVEWVRSMAVLGLGMAVSVAH